MTTMILLLHVVVIRAIADSVPATVVKQADYARAYAFFFALLL